MKEYVFFEKNWTIIPLLGNASWNRKYAVYLENSL